MIFAEFKVTNGSWKYMGREWADASTAFVAAHDLFEHGENDCGTIEQELMALGAGLILRTTINPDDRNPRTIGNDIYHVLSTYFSPAVGIEPHNPKYRGALIPELQENLAIAKNRLIFRNKINQNKISENTIENAMAWVHIGLFNAFIKHGKRLEFVRDTFRDMWKVFIKYSRSMDDGIMQVALDFDSGFDFEWTPEYKY